jgi:hypothetical protein
MGLTDSHHWLLEEWKPSLLKKCQKVDHKICSQQKACAIYTDYLRALDAEMSSQNTKTLLSIDLCAAYPQDTSYLKNVKVVSPTFPPPPPRLHHYSATTGPENDQVIQATYKKDCLYDWSQAAS